jgi:hypothetical protein
MSANVLSIRGLSQIVVNFSTDLAGVRDILVFVKLQVRFENGFVFEAWTALVAFERSFVGMRNAVPFQLRLLLEAFSADNARIVFSGVKIPAMFLEEIEALEFHATNRALSLAGKLPFFSALSKSENWSIF